MSSVALTVPASVETAGSTLRDRKRWLLAPGLGDWVIVEFAAADDVRSGMARVAAMLRRGGGAGRVEWWSAVQLARRNQALEDFAALVAHELKTPLQLAHLQHDPLVEVDRALELVDALLEAARAESAAQACASAADCLDEALRDLGPITVEVTADLPREAPLTAMALRVILRNLIANAVAAGARHIHVGAVSSAASWVLVVDDDGVGVAESGGCAGGSRLGLSLCRRLAGRFGGTLELAPRSVGGTRASVMVDRSRR